MIALVLVGHSAELARGLRSVVRQSAPGVPVELAAGSAREGLGTSAELVERALIAALRRADGALVLVDLGSAAMAVEVAVEELAPADRARIRVTWAPFVEGAVQAAVEAAGGASLDEVAAAAERAGGPAKLGGAFPDGRPGPA